MGFQIVVNSLFKTMPRTKGSKNKGEQVKEKKSQWAFPTEDTGGSISGVRFYNSTTPKKKSKQVKNTEKTQRKPIMRTVEEILSSDQQQHMEKLVEKKDLKILELQELAEKYRRSALEANNTSIEIAVLTKDFIKKSENDSNLAYILGLITGACGTVFFWMLSISLSK
jgi:hypothetical protein